jgi:hypothetical protein
VKSTGRFLPRVLFLATLTIIISSSPAMIQGKQMAPHTDIPGAIDGSKTPELIPDSVAFRMFFEAISEPPLPTAEQVRRQRAKLLRAHLSEGDLNVVQSEMEAFHTAVQQLKVDYAAALKTASMGTQQFDARAWQARRDAITDSARLALEQHITPSGVRNLESFIRSRKVNMIVFPPPSESHAGMDNGAK